MANDPDRLTYEEAISIIKAVTAFNNGNLEFLHDYLKYADQLSIHTSRDSEKITVKVGMENVH